MSNNIDLKIGYTKPDYSLDKEKERKLVRIATRLEYIKLKN